MQQTFANLPQPIEKAIEQLLTQEESTSWVSAAEKLHQRYLDREQGESYIQSEADALAYVALRFPATYAQIIGTFHAVREAIPSWQPKTVLDIGSGPGTGVFAAQSMWPNIESAKCIDANRNLLNLGERIVDTAEIPVDVHWYRDNIRKKLEGTGSYDLVLFANVLNEFSAKEIERHLDAAYQLCTGVMVIVEPGTSYGNAVIEQSAKHFAATKSLVAPYIEGNFVPSTDYWIHFSQRFIRPEFQRRLRQHMRSSSLMASDWENTKYSYVAISKIPSAMQAWGRSIGPVKKQKGYIEVPVLIKDEIVHIKVMKRNKSKYTFAKDLQWGELINNSDLIIKSL